MTPKRITYRMNADDILPGPDVGDVLLSSRSAYVVVTARRVKTRDGSRKYALGVHRYPREASERVGTATGPGRIGHGTGLVYNLVWDSRAPSRQRSAPPR